MTQQNPSIQIDLPYSDAVAVFSNEAFYEFASKIDFNPAEQEYSYSTPPPLPIISASASPAEPVCTCCAACKRQRLDQRSVPQQQQQQYWQTYFNSTYPSHPNTSSVYSSSLPKPTTRAPKSESSIPLLRTLQNRLIWTTALQKKFLQALDHFGLENG